MNKQERQRNFEELRTRIITYAGEEFRKHGLKEVTMDDIAQGLHMSKRTLYQIFIDKQELILACIDHFDKLIESHCEEVKSSSSNVLELMLKLLEYRVKELRSCSSAYFMDMVRYPAVLHHVQSKHARHIFDACVEMNKGVEEGFFLPGLNFQVIHKAMFDQFIHSIQEHTFDAYRLDELFINLCIVPLRGCCQAKGIELLDGFMKEHFKIA